MIDSLFEALREIYDYFGYVEDWCVFPVHDDRHSYWFLAGGDDRGMGATLVTSSLENVRELHEEYNDRGEGGMHHEESVVFTNRHLPRWVYRAEYHTMVLVDTHTDGNKWLSILDNAKER
jgi:hypothetical protein